VEVSIAVEVVEVARAEPDERLWGGNIEGPHPGDAQVDGGVEVVGWVLGRSPPCAWSCRAASRSSASRR
jgi:hypothetical protein